MPTPSWSDRQEPSPGIPTALFWAGVAGLVAVHATLAWLGRQPTVGTGHDDAVYLSLARALRGFSYRETFYSPPAWHSQYPPGYPALLAIAGAIGGSFDLYTAVALVSSAAALVLFCDACRRLAGPLPALALLAVCAVNRPLVDFAGEVASEAPFMASIAVALWALTPSARRLERPVLAGAAAIFACFVRSAGVPLVAAVMLYWLFQRRWKAALALGIAAALTFGPWLLWTALAPHQIVGRSYVADLRLVGTVDEGTGPAWAFYHRFVAYMGSAVPSALSILAIPGTWVDNLLQMALIVSLLAVGVVAAWQRWRVLALFGLCYAGMLLVWPWAQTRFVYPVIPVLWALLLLGALALGERFRPRLGLALGGVLVLSALAGGLWNIYRTPGWRGCDRRDPTRSPTCFSDDQRSYFAAAAWAREHTPADAVFLTSKDVTWYYYSGRRVIRSIPVQGVAAPRLLDYLSSVGASYIVLANVKGNELKSLSWKYRQVCRSLDVVAEFPPRTYLFRVRAEPGDDRACRALAAYRATFRHR